jgi:hypothetical protein
MIDGGFTFKTEALAKIVYQSRLLAKALPDPDFKHCSKLEKEITPGYLLPITLLNIIRSK